MIRIPRVKVSRFAGAACFFLIFLLALGALAGQEEVSYSPAEFIRELSLPGSGNHFLRPARILIDRNTDEILIADHGNNRMVIFDRGGVYNFEFSVGEYCGVPNDVAVDSEGRIYLLGSASGGRRVFVFDYDGEFLREINPGEGSTTDSTNIESIAIDSDDNLFTLDGLSHRIRIFDSSGTPLRDFPVLGDIPIEEKSDTPVVSMVVFGDDIYLPVPVLGTVYRYDRRGNLINLIGHGGTTTGELSFPVSVSVTGDGIVLVLDKHRFLVVCYTREGRFLGEFGGKGVSPGWFYHPSWLDVDSEDRVYIAQIFHNRVQVCSLPGFIRSKSKKTIDTDRLN